MRSKTLIKVSLIGLFMSVLSCKTKSKVDRKKDSDLVKNHQIDTTNVLPVLELETEKDKLQPVYHGSRRRIVDILNTTLHLSFNWDNEKIFGKADITLKPYFKDINEVVLDANFIKTKSVHLDGKPLKFISSDHKLKITLPRFYQNHEEIMLSIVYEAQPSKQSDIDSEELGLFFKHNGDYPKHIWTQGEVANNSNWYPTIDSPNEKMTQELFVTIADHEVSLSNGSFLGTVFNENGTKTDHWKLDQPHSPYLTMLFVGEFSMIRDQWKGKDLYYLVEPDYTSRAIELFGRTPEMLTFFSDKLGVDYPWPKLGQVITRDFTAGGMENTGAIVYYDAMYKEKAELLGRNFDDLVAHEIFHQWFGDLTTCESWANLSLNESFATYGEYLWIQEKNGNMEADYHLDLDLENYLQESFGKTDPIVKFDYETPGDLFDNHRYAKGGRVLHMLRNYVGEDAFFQSLNVFLNENAYKNVEMPQLRMAFEEVTGEDLHWFFDQWFSKSGHPELTVETTFENNQIIIDVRQEQNLDTYPLYQIPLTVDIYDSGRISRKQIFIKNQHDVFKFDVFSKPDLVDVDGDKILLGIIGNNKTKEELAYQFLKTYKFKSKQEALTQILETKNTFTEKVIDAALNEDFWYFRWYALEHFDVVSPDLYQKYFIQVIDMARSDKHPKVQLAALNVLGKYYEQNNNELVYKQLLKSDSYQIRSKALTLFADLKPAEGLDVAIRFDKTGQPILEQAVGYVYAQRATKGFNEFFLKKLKSDERYDVFFPLYSEYLSNQKEEAYILQGMNVLEQYGRTDSEKYKRYYAVYALIELERMVEEKHSEKLELKNRIHTLVSSIMQAETDSELQAIYKGE